VRPLPNQNLARYTELVNVREDKRILELVDQVVEARGSDRSTVYREAIRHFLAAKGLLDKENLRILGIRLEGE
jgi:metal-responsive CopG/Arc/MetJ family transcriptional regulator